MKFLLDVNMSYRIGELLRTDGHECRQAIDIGLETASDADSIATARAAQEIIVTHDLDFGTLLAFSGECAPSVIIFRLQNVVALTMYHRLMNAWADIEKALADGAIVLIEPAGLRVRSLPVRRGAGS